MIQHPLLRSALALPASGLAGLAVLRTTADLRHPVAPTFEAVLVAGAAHALLLGTLWGALLAAAALVEAASAGRLPATRWVGCPRGVRRVLLAGLGTGLGAALVGAPGVAVADPGSATGGAPTTVRPVLAVPSRPLTSTTPTAVPPPPSRGRVLVVRPGDTLWGLAAGRLPPRAPDRRVAELAAALHRRNAVVIGPDADLIRPGQRLVVPPEAPEPRDTHRDPHPDEETP